MCVDTRTISIGFFKIMDYAQMLVQLKFTVQPLAIS